MAGQHVDVLIVGAGVSGIGAACHLVRECPGKTPSRSVTGVRSDSDMLTLGFRFRPWRDINVLADGRSIRAYLRDTAHEYGIEESIRFGARVIRASWSSVDNRWTVETCDAATGERAHWTADFLIAGTGYYDYDNGYRPEFPGEKRFGGTLVHPQHWPENLDYRGKRIVIIGSGATAVTLLPALAAEAGHVTMLQRSPGYIVALPARDRISAAMHRVLPARMVYKLSRGRNIAVQLLSYRLARARPDMVRVFVAKGVRRQLGADVEMRHFTPTYEPWDQRLCIPPTATCFGPCAAAGPRSSRTGSGRSASAASSWIPAGSSTPTSSSSPRD